MIEVYRGSRGKGLINLAYVGRPLSKLFFFPGNQMTRGHKLSFTVATAGFSAVVHFNTPSTWVALGAIAIICIIIAVVAVAYLLSQNRGETKQN